MGPGDSLVAILLVVLAFAGFWYWMHVRERHHRDRARYQLFELRGRLMTLALEGIISTDSYVFRWLYACLNLFIKYSERMHLGLLLAAIRQGGPVEEKVVQRISAEVKKGPPEVQQVVVDFFDATARIFIVNTLRFRRLAHPAVPGFLIYILGRSVGEAWARLWEFDEAKRKVVADEPVSAIA